MNSEEKATIPTKVSCSECGVAILSATADKHGGKCAQCAKLPKRVFKNSDALTRLVRILLYIQIAVAMASIVSGLMERQLLLDINAGLYTNDWELRTIAETNDFRQLIAATVEFAVLIVSGIFILKWIYRANSNASALGAKNMQYSPWGSIIWYFVPIAALWMPYQAMKEIWKTSISPADWENVKPPALIDIWWAIWIAIGASSTVINVLSKRADTIDHLSQINLFNQVVSAGSIALAAVTLLMVDEIHKAQKQQYSTLTASNG